MEIREFDESLLDAVFEIQRAAYQALYIKYQDEATSPYLESQAELLQKYSRPGTKGYVFLCDGVTVGAVRLMLTPGDKSARISALAVLPAYQGQGIAQRAMTALEKLHPEVETWRLETIMQEAGTCHLYEKLGYRRTGRTGAIKENMTLVYYEKRARSSL